MSNCYNSPPYLIPYQRGLFHNEIQLRYNPLLDGYEFNYILTSDVCLSCLKYELSLTVQGTNEKYIIGYETVLNDWRYVLISGNTYNLALAASVRNKRRLLFTVSCVS